MLDRSDQHPEPQLQPRLADDLGRLYSSGPSVPPGLDAEILGRARSRFARQRRLSFVLHWSGAAGAAAAVILLAVWVGHTRNPAARTPPSVPMVFAREDIDRNGQVNILDAFVLARRIENETGAGATHDMNGDGRIDQADVDAIANSAVRLDRGSLQ